MLPAIFLGIPVPFSHGTSSSLDYEGFRKYFVVFVKKAHTRVANTSRKIVIFSLRWFLRNFAKFIRFVSIFRRGWAASSPRTRQIPRTGRSKVVRGRSRSRGQTREATQSCCGEHGAPSRDARCVPGQSGNFMSILNFCIRFHGDDAVITRVAGSQRL